MLLDKNNYIESGMDMNNSIWLYIQLYIVMDKIIGWNMCIWTLVHTTLYIRQLYMISDCVTSKR